LVGSIKIYDYNFRVKNKVRSKYIYSPKFSNFQSVVTLVGRLKIAAILFSTLSMLMLPVSIHALTLSAKYPNLEFKDSIANSDFEYSSGWVVEKGSASGTSTYYFLGNKSWHVSTSGGQFSIYQTPSENVEDYIKGKNVQFSFWFKPEQTSGEIYAQIKYLTTNLRTSYIYTWNGTQYTKDNNTNNTNHSNIPIIAKENYWRILTCEIE